MTSVPFRVRAYFLKWMWLTMLLFVTEAPTILCAIHFVIPDAVLLMINPLNLTLHGLLYFLYAFRMGYGVLSIYDVLSSYRRRKEVYLELYNIYSKHPEDIKTSVLYSMMYTKCYSCVAHQLCRDFNIHLA